MCLDLGFIVPGACMSAALVTLLVTPDLSLVCLLLLAQPGLSTYMPLRKEPPFISDANLKTPIFQAHGDMDTTVRNRGTRGRLFACLF